MTSSCVERGHLHSHASVRAEAFRRVLLACVVGLFLSSLAGAHVPVPDSVLNPQSAPEAWNVLRLSTANIERLVREGRLTEVPDQASLCSPALRTLARLATGTPAQKEVIAGTLHAASAVNSLAQICIAGDHASVGPAMGKLRASFDALASGVDPRIVNSEIFFCQMHPDVVSLDGKATCPKCGMALTLRRIPYSFVYASPPGEASMRLSASSDVPPLAGRPMHVRVCLTMRDGSPVREADLLVAHTQRIHLLIVDPAREDYHHEHPTPTGTPGEYEFCFTPARTGSYRIYADVVPASTGIQEYVPADLHGAEPRDVDHRPRTIRPNAFAADTGGLSFRLETGSVNQEPLKARQACTLKIMIHDSNGAPIARLEPVMNAFAHLVGFYDDDRTVVHLHPVGADVVDAGLRGGPALEFRFYPPKEGSLRLYCQVLVDGKMIFAPFDITITP